MNKTILITNASDKIGKATAIFFAEQGWNVAATMPSPEKGKDLLKYKNIKIYELNFCEKDFVDILENIIIDYSKLHAALFFVNIGKIGLFEQMSLNTIEELFTKNVLGFMKLTKAVLPYFRKQQMGKMLMILPSENADSLPFHAVQKSFIQAIQGFCQSLASEVNSFGIELDFFELPLLHSDFYENNEWENEADKSEDYGEYYAEQKKYLQEFLQKSDSISEFSELIFNCVQNKKTKFTVEPVNLKKNKNQKISGILVSKWKDAIQKMSKKK